MGKFIVEKSQPLSGTVTAIGAKNAALPVLAASVLSGDVCRLSNIPDVSDVRDMTEILQHLGAEAEELKRGKMCIDSSKIKKTEATVSVATRLRASFLVMGPLLARFGRAEVALPEGVR